MKIHKMALDTTITPEQLSEICTEIQDNPEAEAVIEAMSMTTFALTFYMQGYVDYVKAFEATHPPRETSLSPNPRKVLGDVNGQLSLTKST